MPPSFDFPDSPVVGEEYTPADATFVWSGKVWSVKKPVEQHGIDDVPPFPAGEVYGRSVNRWVPLDTTDMSLRIAGVGLDNVGPQVNLQPANTKGEIGGVIVVGRSPLNGLEYDLATGTIWVPPGTDILAGSIVEPPNDGMQYVRMRSNDLSSWVPAGAVSVGPLPPLGAVPGSLWWRNDPDGDLYLLYDDGTSTQWVAATKGPGSPIVAGDDPPTSPMVNQLWWESDTGALFIYWNDGTSSQWIQVVGGNAGDAAVDFLPLTGGTLSGALLLPTARPQWPEEAAHKNYVDQTVAESALYQGVWQVAANTPDLNTVTKLNAYSWIAQTAVATTPEAAPAGIPGIGGLMIGSGDTIKWNEALAIYEQIKVAGAAGNFVPIAGGTMSGALYVQTAAGTNKIAMLPGDASNAGRIEWTNPDNTRKAYFGYRASNLLELNLDSAAQFNITGGMLVCTQTTAGANGIFVGDPWHGMYFNGSNTLVFTEYHNRFEWRTQTTGAQPGGTLVMSLYSGDLNILGDLNVGATIDNNGNMAYLGHIQSSSHIEAVQNVYALSFIVQSDLALKHDVRPMVVDEVNAAFDAFSPIRFRWNEADDQRLQWGLSANDLERGVPDAVSTNSLGKKGYSVEQVLAIVIAKIKQLEDKNEMNASFAHLRDEITSLRAEIARLRGR